MNKATRYFRLAGASLLLMLAGAAAADETEIFTGAGNTVSSELPNILFIIDSSGSMSTNVVTQVPFNPATTYAGTCSTSRVYFIQGTNSSAPPSCTNGNSFPVALLKCNAATAPMASQGYYVAAPAAMWRGNGPRWRDIQGGNPAATAWVECKADAGVHGDGVILTKLWAADQGNGPWSSNSAQAITWTANNANGSYVFYTGNYINWLLNGSTITQTRLQIVQQAASDTVDQLAAANNTNIGLMRYSNNTNNGCDNTATAEGGMVLQPVLPVAANAATTKALINAINADGCTPLSETMYEAYQYLSGARVVYGLNSHTVPGAAGLLPSVLSSRVTGNTGVYQSPLQTSCQKNFIVLLTDGLPTADNSANTAIQGLIGGNCAGSGDGKCLEEIAKYMYEKDLRPSLAGLQNVTTYTIGFDLTGADAAGKSGAAEYRSRRGRRVL